MPKLARVRRFVIPIIAVLFAACSDSSPGPTDLSAPGGEAIGFESADIAAAAAMCRGSNFDETVDRLRLNPVARLLLKGKVRAFIAVAARGPGPVARVRLGELIGVLLERASNTEDDAERERIIKLIGILFCVMGEQAPELDLYAGGAAIITAASGGTATMPCTADCPPDGGNVAGLTVPADALPPGVPFVLVSIVPTMDPLPTDLPTRGPNFRVSLSPAVELTRTAALAACLDATGLPAGSELLLARGAEGPDEPSLPGAEQDGELAIVPASDNTAAFAAMNLVCQPEAATAANPLLKLVLPRPLYAQGTVIAERIIRGIVAPAPALFCLDKCTWGGVIRLPRAAIGLTPSSVTFTALVAGDAPAPANIDVSNTGLESALVGLAVGSIAYGPGGSGWLTASLTGTTAPTTLSLSADPSGLEEGVYTATVPIAAPQASNSPQLVTVTLRVNGIPLIALETMSASFTAVAGEPSPPAVSIAITNSGGGTLSGISVGPPTYGPGAANWLGAAIGSSAPTVLTLTPNTTNIPSGTYTATVQVRSALATNSPQTVEVDLTVEEPPPSALRFSSVHSGQGRFACALTPEGKAYCWGPNNRGQLGDGTTINRLRPTEVLQPDGVTFTQISTGTSHTCAITPAGQAYCWGDNTVGELGSPPDLTSTPVVVPRTVEQGSRVFVQITSGNGQTCALEADGSAYCWGSNSSGHLGVGIEPMSGNLATLYITRPMRVVQPEGVVFTTIIAGLNRICAVNSTGQAYCWGRNHLYQLGDGTTEDRAVPTAVAQPAGVVFTDVTIGTTFTCGVTTVGDGYCWGRDHNGSFGRGVSGGDHPTPTPAAVGYGPWLAFDAGGQFACGINAMGRVYCWGSGRMLGNGLHDSSNIPVEALLPAGRAFVKLSTGDIASCALSDTNELYCWGNNIAGSVGDGTTIDRVIPVRIE